MKRFFLVCLCIVIITSACGGKQPILPTSTPSPTSSPLPSPTLLATSTATPAPTSTEYFTPTPTRILLPFLDDFGSHQYGWGIGPTKGEFADYTFEIDTGIYRWTITPHKNANVTSWPDLPPLEDCTVSVDARQVSGNLTGCDYGFIYKAPDNNQYLSFGISKTKYNVYLFDKTKGWTEIVPWTTTSGIRTGQFNHIKVIAHDHHYQFFVNDKKLTEFSNSKLAEGVLGLNVDVDSGIGVFEFDNFSVTSP